MAHRLAFGAFLVLLVCGSLHAVTPVPVGALLQHKANYFNLEHKRLRFIPGAAGAYRLTVTPYRRGIERGTPAGKPSDPGSYSWRMPLPFSFAFAGRNWNEVYININGSLSFGGPEAQQYPERDTWADGTIRSMASIFDMRATTSKRPMVVPFWGFNSADGTQVFTRATHDAFAVTWRAVRYHKANEGYAPLGESTFQAILNRDGSIEFRYGDVAEKDGIVGIFGGRGSATRVLDHVELPPASNLGPEFDLRRAQVEDRGSDLRFLLTLAGNVPDRSASGVLYYGVALISGGEVYVVRLAVDSAGAKSDPLCQVFNPQDQPVEIDCGARTVAIRSGRTVELYVPKIALKNPAKIEWKAGVGKGDESIASSGELRPISLSPPMPSGCDLSLGGKVSGNVYEIFHYPYLSKARAATFEEIYGQVPAEDELAVAVTDFRIDDIHNAGETIGAGPGKSREVFNSDVLQQAAGPIYLGPRFSELIEDGGRTYRNYAFAVGWIAHELTHHWCARLRWNDQDPFALLEPPDRIHWNPFLYAPAVMPVSSLFTDSPYPEESNMGGMTTEKLDEGGVRIVRAPWGAPKGLSALDLYSMGLIGPEDVPETFFIAGAVPDGKGGLNGEGPVPVRIADIIAANGTRVPAANAQHRFKFQIYLLHEDGREPDRAKLAQARGIEAMVTRYFAAATNGRMIVVPTR